MVGKAVIHNTVRANRFRVCGTRPRDTRNKDVTQQPGEGDYAAAATGSVKSPPNPRANREEEEEEEERKRGRWSCSRSRRAGWPDTSADHPARSQKQNRFQP